MTFLRKFMATMTRRFQNHENGKPFRQRYPKLKLDSLYILCMSIVYFVSLALLLVYITNNTLFARCTNFNCLLFASFLTTKV